MEIASYLFVLVSLVMIAGLVIATIVPQIRASMTSEDSGKWVDYVPLVWLMILLGLSVAGSIQLGKWLLTGVFALAALLPLALHRRWLSRGVVMALAIILAAIVALDQALAGETWRNILFWPVIALLFVIGMARRASTP